VAQGTWIQCTNGKEKRKLCSHQLTFQHKSCCVRHHALKYDMKPNILGMRVAVHLLIQTQLRLILCSYFANRQLLLQNCRLIICDEVKIHDSRWLLSKVGNSKAHNRMHPTRKASKRKMWAFLVLPPRNTSTRTRRH
jgi:hypothetical protein